MVHFTSEPGDDAPRERLAPVTYLRGAEPRGDAAIDIAGTAAPVASLAPSAGSAASKTQPDRGGKAATRAANVSIHQLARRGMSRWELGQVLAKRGVDETLAAAELDRLESVGLVDDAALAVTLVYTQHTRRGLGRAAIAQELRRRHVDAVIIEDALSEIADDDELERATELALKRVPQLHAVDDDTAARRLNGFLARKGYGNSVVRAAVEKAMATRGGRVRFE
jgi:regulatory protein